MIIKTKLKSIGGSLGICQAIPKDFVNENKLKENSEIIVEIKGLGKAGDLFGFLKDWKRPTPEIMEHINKGWE